MMMELSVEERLNLLIIIPKQGSMATMRLIRTLRNLIDFSDEEHVKWTLKPSFDISKGCPRCPDEEVAWLSLPHAPLLTRCSRCGFITGLGPPGSTVWRTLDEDGNELDQTADIEFGEAGMELIRDTLELFNTKDEIDDNTFPLYVKFVEEQGAEVGEAA